MKFLNLFVFTLCLLGLLSCEKEADPVDFVDPNAFEELFGPPQENVNIPSTDNPILIGEANGVSFNLVSAVLRQESEEGQEILTIDLVDEIGNQLTITIPNPESRSYAVNVPGTPSFDVEYIDAQSGDAFFTMQTGTSNSSEGTFVLDYRFTASNTAEVNATFSFVAFVETAPGVPPGRFIEFEQGNLVNLPVEIIN